jgi:hypothetical protein
MKDKRTKAYRTIFVAVKKQPSFGAPHWWKGSQIHQLGQRF